MNLSRRFLSAVGAAAMLAFSSEASAIPFSITAAQFLPGTGYGIDGNEGSPNLLDVRFSTDAFSPLNFALSAVNQSFTFNFGTINMQEPNAHGGIVDPAELDGLGISARLTFTAPTGVIQTVTTTGVATAGSVSDSHVDYVVDWSPVTVQFAGGSFRISLADMSFDGLGSQFQTATVTLLCLSADCPPPATPRTPVPEPASLLLFGTGLVGAGVKRWRKNRA